MRKTLVALLTVLAVTLGGYAWAGDIQPVLFQGGPGDQVTGMGNTEWRVWSSNSTRERSRYNAYARKDGSRRIKLNARGTKGFFGSLNDDTSQAIYQQASGGGRLGARSGRSNIYLYNLQTKRRHSPGNGVNTKLWEWSPSVSADHILFGRNDLRRNGSLWRVMLYDRDTHTVTRLDSARNRCRCIFPGQVTDEYATWTKCSQTLCQSWYYTIGTDVSAMIPNPLDEQTYYPAVTATTGNLYFARSGTGCGAGTQILSWHPVVGGAPELISTLPAERDLAASSMAFHDAGGHDDVYLSMLICSGRFASDLYKIDDAETGASRLPASGRSAAPQAAKELLPPGAVPTG